MSTHNIYFYGELEKIIPELSSNTPLKQVFCQKKIRRLFRITHWKEPEETSKRIRLSEQFLFCEGSCRVPRFFLAFIFYFFIYLFIFVWLEVTLKASKHF